MIDFDQEAISKITAKIQEMDKSCGMETLTHNVVNVLFKLQEEFPGYKGEIFYAWKKYVGENSEISGPRS